MLYERCGMYDKTWARKISFALAVLWMPSAVCFGGPEAQQGQPALQIISPTNNAIVNSGQTISISVISPTNATFALVGVIGDIGTSSTASSVPAQLSLSIPSQIALGKHTLTAVGTTPTKQVLYSGPVDVDVERADLPTRMTLSRKNLVFRSQGALQTVSAYGTFADGSYVDLTESSDLVFSSSNTSVATVDSHGNVRSVSQGTATITATYTVSNSQGTQTVSASVPVSVPPPVITRSPAALNFNDNHPLFHRLTP